MVLARGELDRLEGPGYAARRAELRRKAKEAERTRERLSPLKVMGAAITGVMAVMAGCS